MGFRWGLRGCCEESEGRTGAEYAIWATMRLCFLLFISHGVQRDSELMSEYLIA